MFSRVRSYIANEVKSGRLSLTDAARIQAALNSVAKTNGIFSLPDNLLAVATIAFKKGLQWAFLSLIPWLGIAWILVLFLQPIDPARLDQKRGQSTRNMELKEEQREEEQGVQV